MGWLNINGNWIGRHSGQSWSSYWTTLISVVVENAQPTKVVLTYSTGKVLLATDYTITGKTISGIVLSANNTVHTLTVTAAFTPGATATITFNKGTGLTSAITNNVVNSWAAKLVQTAPIYTESMEATDDWTVASGTLAVNNVEKFSGNASLKLTSDPGVTASISKTINWNFAAISSYNSFLIRVYPHTAPTTTFSSVKIYLMKDASNYYVLTVTPSQLTTGVWTTASALIYGWVQEGTPGLVMSTLKIELITAAAQVAEVSLDILEMGEVNRPGIVLTFDDIDLTTYTLAYPQLASRKMVGTGYQVSDYIGTAGKLTTAQLQELYAAGWDIGNHSKTHTPFTSLTQPQIEAELEACKTALEALGLTRATKHVAYPSGSANATVWAAMTAWGAKTGRGGGIGVVYDRYDIGFPYKINWTNLPSLVNAKIMVDRAKINNVTLIWVFHTFTEGGSDTTTNWTMATLTEFLDYLVTNGFKSLTIDEYYRANAGAITTAHE